MGAVDLGGMAPDIVLAGKLKGQLIVLPVVPAHIDGVAVGRLEAHGGLGLLLLPTLGGVDPDIPAGTQFLTDLFQIRLALGPVQLLQDALQVLQLLGADGDLLGQLLLGGLHPGVVLIEFGGVLLGREDFRDGDLDEGHLLVVKILAFHGLFALADLVDIGGEDVAQLAKPLPVVGGGQLLFLDGQLSFQPGHQILDGLAKALALLADGILSVPEGVEAVQQRAKAFGAAIFAVLPDGAEGILLRASVREAIEIGSGMLGMLPEEEEQFLSLIPPYPGIHAAAREKGRLPADQRGKAAQIIHQPVAEQVRPGGGEYGFKVRLGHGGGVLLLHRPGTLIVESRQGGPVALVQADAPQALQDPALLAHQVQIAGPAHQLRDQLLLSGVAHLVGAVEYEFRHTLHGQLADLSKFCA